MTGLCAQSLVLAQAAASRLLFLLLDLADKVANELDELAGPEKEEVMRAASIR